MRGYCAMAMTLSAAKARDSFVMKSHRIFFCKQKILEDCDTFELQQLKALEVTYLFGNSKEELYLTDWQGEENEKEIEDFIEDTLKVEIDWKHVSALRKRVDITKQRDGKFIIDLFAAVDKDLKPLNKKLVFLDLNWDAYVYAIVEQSSYQTIIDRLGEQFHGSEELRK